MDKKSEIKSLIELGYQAEQTLYGRLSPAERARQGTLKHWAAKDGLLHSAIWIQRYVESVRCRQRGEAPPDYDKYLDHNDQDFQANYQLTWEEVTACSADAHRLALELLDSLREEDLQSSAWSSNERALWRELTGNVFTHPMMHLIQIYLDREDIDHADEVNDLMMENLNGMDDNPHWQGTQVYNDACHKARTKRKKQAIKKLSQALKMRPDLTSWAQEDTDLESLHDDPEFQALFASES